ncbi:hypothetical protein QEM27_005236 [Pseudomonas putida]|nr:hypothetical protein [Pseudomonas putida]EKT8868632.1 hypothetical protein [Pseudomonas putida]
MKKYAGVDIVFVLIPHEDIEQDFERLDLIDPAIGDQAGALIQQLLDDPELVDDLLRDGYGGTPRNPAPSAIFNVRTWGDAQRVGMNLWALRDFELSLAGFEYRIVYAVFPRCEQIYILAIVERAWNYDLSHPISRRIVATYRSLEEDL